MFIITWWYAMAYEKLAELSILILGIGQYYLTL